MFCCSNPYVGGGVGGGGGGGGGVGGVHVLLIKSNWLWIIMSWDIVYWRKGRTVCE